MFSSGGEATDFIVVPDAGEPFEVNPADYVAVLRAELPLNDLLPPHLCSSEPEAAAIILRTSTSEETVTCSGT